MSQTTTAAESRRRGCPSFDSVWANLPEELSPTSAYHGDSFVLDEDESCFNVNDLCRNTFVHLDSSSPLARLSVQDLVRSFKQFSASIAGPTDDEPGPSESTPRFTPKASAKWSEPQSPVTPATAISPGPAAGDGWPVVAQGSMVDFVRDYTFKATPQEDGNLLLLTPSPVVQSLLYKKESPPAMESPNVNSTSSNADSPTVYRDGHPINCKPCAFFWSKGCLNGDNCQFCHLWHVPKRKKPMREQRNLMIIAKDDGKITFLRCSIKDVIN